MAVSMSEFAPTLDSTESTFEADRRQGSVPPGSLLWVRGLVRRPRRVTRRDGGLRLTVVDRRRPPEVIQAERLQQLRQTLCEELPARLHGQEIKSAAVVMRHLNFVHHKLVRRGWKGVAALNSRVLGRATVQAQMLASHDASPAVVQLIRQLRLLQAAAAQREERQTQASHGDRKPTVEVSEASLDDYEASERGWLDTVSPPT
jgi:hypothetical protein